MLDFKNPVTILNECIHLIHRHGSHVHNGESVEIYLVYVNERDVWGGFNMGE